MIQCGLCGTSVNNNQSVRHMDKYHPDVSTAGYSSVAKGFFLDSDELTPRVLSCKKTGCDMKISVPNTYYVSSAFNAMAQHLEANPDHFDATAKSTEKVVKFDNSRLPVASYALKTDIVVFKSLAKA